MKGVELLASILALLMMIGITAIMGGLVILALNLEEAPSTREMTYEMQLSSKYPPIKYETMLLSYMESTDTTSGFQVKKILTYAAYQKNVTNVYVEGREVTTLPISSFAIFSQWLEGNGFILALNIEGRPYVIAENRRAFPIAPDRLLSIKIISVPTYIDVETFKINKNVTLDLYVQ